MSGLHLSSAFFFLGLIAAQAIASAQITTSQGAFLGADDEQFVSFKGIPYALPPTGGRRWLAPAPAPVHDGIRQATSFGPNCPQQEPVSPGQPTRAMAEDCLTLNVWSPPIGEVKRPVMVWIHGGGFRSGSGDMRGELIASEGLVVVSINYRLGPLGFFAHKSLEDFPANPGLLDIELALQWVQDNIAAFGGDPRNVTIFGVSAGGMAVNLLMASDNARGLFAKAIAHSGYATWALPRSRSAPNPAPRSIAMATAQSAEGLASKLIGRISSAPQWRELARLATIRPSE